MYAGRISVQQDTYIGALLQRSETVPVDVQVQIGSVVVFNGDTGRVLVQCFLGSDIVREFEVEFPVSRASPVLSDAENAVLTSPEFIQISAG